MNHPSHRPIAVALALPILASAATTMGMPATVAADPLGLDCSTEALSVEEIEAGATSTVTCTSRSEGGTQGAGTNAAATLATHYTGAGGTGDALTVTGVTCDGSGVAFSSGSPWNNQVRSTRNGACANAKHFANADYTGANQTTSGSYGTLTNIGSPLNTQISSIGYSA